MKKSIILFIMLSFLLQSCHSYETIHLSYTKLTPQKTYKIKTNKRFAIVKFKSENDSTATFIFNKTEKQIPLSEIKEIKKRNFSAGKTIVLIPVLMIGLIIGSFVISPDINVVH